MLIAHISDTHVRPRGQLYQGVVDSNAMLAAAVDTINALDPPPDLIVFSGDLVDEGRPEEYAMARELLQPLRQKLLMIPGNHDHRQNLRDAFPEHDYFINDQDCSFVYSGSAPVRIIGLDISVPDQHHGDMTDTATQWLDRTLALEPDKPTLIMMHQPPFSSGIPYIDAYRCERGRAAGRGGLQIPGHRAHRLWAYSSLHATALRRDADVYGAEHDDGHRLATAPRGCRRFLCRTACIAAASLESRHGPDHPLGADRSIRRAF